MNYEHNQYQTETKIGIYKTKFLDIKIKFIK